MRFSPSEFCLSCRVKEQDGDVVGCLVMNGPLPGTWGAREMENVPSRGLVGIFASFPGKAILWQ